MTINFDEFKKAHANYSSIGAHKEDSWRMVLSILNREGWTPYEYLDFVFREFKRPMVPQLLQSDSTVELFRTAREERIALSKRRSVWVKDQVKLRLKNGYSTDDILADKELERHVLFMYLIAAKIGNKEVSDRLYESALYELRTMPELFTIYSVQFKRRLFPND